MAKWKVFRLADTCRESEGDSQPARVKAPSTTINGGMNLRCPTKEARSRKYRFVENPILSMG